MPRFNTILCPIAFDANSIAALRIASEITEERDSTLHLLHVVTLVPGSDITLSYDQMELKARARLERLARERLGNGIRYDIHVAVGDPAKETIRTADQLGANLIVMATHGRKGLRRLILGSVAEKVIRDAPCPVLSVKPSNRSARATKSKK
jgi:nucleotide-binding universal stress UspA family protein